MCQPPRGGSPVLTALLLTALAAVSPAFAQSPACTVTASPAAIAPGQTATLSWTTQHAIRGALNQGLGALAPLEAGSLQVSPAESSQYTVGVSGPNGSAKCQAVVGVVSDRTAWPPPHMKRLPPDMLERLFTSLQQRVVAPYPGVAGTPRRGNLSWGYLNYALAALLLGQNPEKANAYLQQVEILWSDGENLGKAILPAVARIYLLFNDKSTFLPGRLTREAQSHLEQQMWKYVSQFSSLDPAVQKPARPPNLAYQSAQLTPDIGNVWIGGSENHHSLFAGGKLLYTQILKDLPDYATRPFIDGRTARQHYEAWRRFMSAYFDEHAKRGLFMEVASPGYEMVTLDTIFAIYDFAEDPVLRKKAEMLLDLWFASASEEQIALVRGGAKSRVYSGVGSESGAFGAIWTYGNLLFGPLPAREPNLSFTTSGYFPPPVVASILRDVAGRGTYEFIERRAGVGRNPFAGTASKDVDPTVDFVDLNRSVYRYGFATPSYIMGSVILDPVATHVRVSAQNRWQGIIFNGDTEARIYTALTTTGRAITADNFFSLQDRNVLITRKWRNPRANAVHVHFSRSLDLLEERDGWIFVKEGSAYAAVKVVDGGYRWNDPKKNQTTPGSSFITLNTEASPIVMLANEARDYGGDFEKFKRAVQSARLTDAGGKLDFATLTFYPDRIGKRNGVTPDIQPKLGFDSPFIRSAFGSGLIYIRKGADTLMLDFSHPDAPVRQVGAPATSEFPPGVGTGQPVVLGAPN